MNKSTCFFLCLLLMVSFNGLSQTPVSGVQWKHLIGTDTTEYFSKIIPAQDGNGYLLIGGSAGNGIYDDRLYSDLWLVKINKEGYVEWERRYGGSGAEWGAVGIATSDNGFLIAASTSSFKNDGEVSGHHNANEGEDIWVLKIDKMGVIEWAKTYGGSASEFPNAIVRSSDGNYVVAGVTNSWDGDLTGIRNTDPVYPSGDTNSEDAWLFKIDQTGNIIWQQSYGGNSMDYISSVIAEPNNELAVVGLTRSIDHDLQGLRTSSWMDAWFFRVNASGTILLNKTYGGTRDDQFQEIASYNNKYYFVGASNSGDGDLSNCSIDTSRFYNGIVIMETDANGAINWNTCITVPTWAVSSDLKIIPGKGIYVLGQAENRQIFRQYDFAHNLVADMELGSGVFASMLPVSDKEFYFAGTLTAENGIPDGLHYYGGNSDACLVYYGDVNIIKGQVFLDVNVNGIRDAGELLINGAQVISNKTGSSIASTTKNGLYSNAVDTGSYATKVIPVSPHYMVTPASRHSVFTTYYNVDSVVDFAMQPIPGRKDLVANILPLSPARPGFAVSYQLKIFNPGTEAADTALVKWVKSPLLTITSSDHAYTVSSDTMYWPLSNIHPLDTVTIKVAGKVASSPAVNVRDTLKSIVTVWPLTGDITPYNNADTLKQIVTSSYDPNDKTESHGGIITPAHVSGNVPLTYLIRFQNTGTDTAFSVTVRDTLESRLDWNSFEMIGASHPYQLTIDDNNKLTWTFNNILLPDSNVNEPASHGYIAYRIKPKSTVMAGDTIRNTAAIYFDFNLPVLTNMQKTAVVSLAALPVNLTSFKALLKGDVVDVNWKTAAEYNTDLFEIQRSNNGVDFSTIGTVKAKNAAFGSSYQFTDEKPLTGYNYYRLRIVDINRSVKLSPVVLVNVKAGNDIVTAIYPNPSNGQVVVNIKRPISGEVILSVIDPVGRVVMTKLLGKPDHAPLLTSLSLGRLPKGLYTLRLTAGQDTWVHRLVIR